MNEYLWFSTNGISWHICIGIKNYQKRFSKWFENKNIWLAGMLAILPLIVNSYYQWSADMQLNIDRQENLFRHFSNVPRLILELFPMRLQILMQPTHEFFNLFLAKVGCALPMVKIWRPSGFPVGKTRPRLYDDKDPDGEIENSGKSIFEIRIPNFCYIQVIDFLYFSQFCQGSGLA